MTQEKLSLDESKYSGTYDRNSPAHNTAKLTAGRNKAKNARVTYHPDGSATIHTQSSDTTHKSSLRTVDDHHQEHGMQYNNSRDEYKNRSSVDSKGLTHKTKQIDNDHHEIHISNKQMKENKMTQGVKDLIDAIALGDSLAIESAFNSEMANRISDRLDDMRVDVAQKMFATESVQEELDEEQLDEEVKPSLSKLAADHFHHGYMHAIAPDAEGISDARSQKHGEKQKETEDKIKKHYGDAALNDVKKHTDHAHGEDFAAAGEQPKNFHKDFVKKHLGGDNSEYKARLAKHGHDVDPGFSHASPKE